MQFQSDILRVPINILDLEEASAMGAVLMNGFARKVWTSFQDVSSLRKNKKTINPIEDKEKMDLFYMGWLRAIEQLIK